MVGSRRAETSVNAASAHTRLAEISAIGCHQCESGQKGCGAGRAVRGSQDRADMAAQCGQFQAGEYGQGSQARNEAGD